MLSDYGIIDSSLVIYCDNESAINISKNPIQYYRMEHIDIRYHFIRDLVENRILSVLYVPTKSQLADIFTKPLDSLRFEFLRKSLGVYALD